MCGVFIFCIDMMRRINAQILYFEQKEGSVMMKLRAPIKGIFFDAGWTLFGNFLPANADWLITNKMLEYVDFNILKAIPQDRKTAAFERGIKYLDDNILMTIMTEDEELRQFEGLYSMIAEDLPELALTKGQIGDIAHSKVFDMENYIFFDDTKSTLEVLKDKYKLGVISDTWPSIERILKHGGIYDYFETKTFS